VVTGRVGSVLLLLVLLLVMLVVLLVVYACCHQSNTHSSISPCSVPITPPREPPLYHSWAPRLPTVAPVCLSPPPPPALPPPPTANHDQLPRSRPGSR
jgi:hypothetical protein